MLRRSRRLFSIGVAVLGVAGSASAQVYQRFDLDPSRSSIAFDSGEISGQLGTSGFAFASLLPQPGTTAVPLEGHFMLGITPNLAMPDSMTTVSGTSDIRPVELNTASPGLGAVPGSAPAAFGVEFTDPFTGVSGVLAFRDMVFALAAGLDVFANGAGPIGLRGNLDWPQAAGRYDFTLDLGIEASLPVGTVPLVPGFVGSSTSQLEEVATGVYEIKLPFSFTLSNFDLPGPVSFASGSATFTGEIVATTDVPEPSLALGLVAGGSLLVGFGRGRGRR